MILLFKSVLVLHPAHATLSLVNIGSHPASLRLNPGRVSPTVCKPATGTTSEGPRDYRRITHLTSTPSTDIPHHSQCLSSARSSPSKLVSNRKRPRKRKGGRSRRRSDNGSAQAGKGRDRWKRPGADDFSQYSPAHVAVLHRRYDTLGFRRLDPMRSASARGGYTSFERGRGAKAVSITGLVIAYGINSLATTLAACTFYCSLNSFRY